MGRMVVGAMLHTFTGYYTIYFIHPSENHKYRHATYLHIRPHKTVIHPVTFT